MSYPQTTTEQVEKARQASLAVFYKGLQAELKRDDTPH